VTRPGEALSAVPVDGGSPSVDAPSALEALLREGKRRAMLAMLGPAFVAAIAYVDPGNFATNVQGGAQYGYLLLRVVLAANLIAMLVQHLSAKLGVVTGQSLPETCRAYYALAHLGPVGAGRADRDVHRRRRVSRRRARPQPALPRAAPVADVMTGFIAFGLLELHRQGYRRFEIAITALLGIILLGFLYERLAIGPSASGAAGGLIPHLAGQQSLYLAVGIIGATVMHHAIYLHSALMQGRMAVRDDEERTRVLRFERIDVLVALGLAGLINVAMLAVAAKLFHVHGHTSSTLSRAPTRTSDSSSAGRRIWPSRSRCSHRPSRPRASARSPARS
jgi:manganese transport protein